MPLENNTGWINNLAGQIANQMGGPGGSSDSVMADILHKILQAIEKLKDQMGSDVTIPVYIGSEMIDEVIVTAQQMRSIRTNRR